jgi:site-specific DNA-cytosine methylase
MNVLSLFDGCSGGQQALDRIGIKVDNYFASEIDKYAIKVTMANYPNTIQVGSVVDLDGYSLPKIELLIGGSPCQSFSFAGKRKGMSTKDDQEILTLDHYLQLKSEGYEFEGQSYLFWEYMRLLNEVKPKYFLLENVMMGEKWEKVLSKAIGVKPIEINSALVSAQNRRRLYWTNIGLEPMGLFGDLGSIIEQPKDKGIFLKDILEKEVEEKYYLSEKSIMYLENRTIENKIKGRGFGAVYPSGDEKSSCIDTRYGALRNSGETYICHNTMPRSSRTGKGGTGPLSRTDRKTYCLDTGSTNAIEMVGAIKFGRTDEAKALRKESMKNGKDHTPFQSKEISGIDYEKMGTLTTAINKDNLLMLNYNQKKKFDHNPNTDKAGCLTLAQGRAGSSDEYMDAVSKIAKIQGNIRRLTPIECERLQTVKDNYTAHVSDSQRYKMLGNGWTVDVISHILSYAKI